MQKDTTCKMMSPYIVGAMSYLCRMLPLRLMAHVPAYE
jgi:hypothetical protein